MANSNIGKSRRGVGFVSLGAYAPAAEDRILKATGNTAAFQITPETESNEIPYTGGPGGLYGLDVRVKAVSISLSFDDWRPELWAAASQGSLADVTAGAVVAEPHKAHLGALVRAAHIMDLSVVPVIKDSTGTTTFLAGTDYTLDQYGAGIVPLVGGTITEDEVLHFGYTKLAHQVIQGLIKPGAEYSLFFSGMNAITGKPEQTDIFRVVLFPDGAQDLILTKPGPLKLKGTALMDPSVVFDPANPLSQFYQIKSA
jgi:hypothetical protein